MDALVSMSWVERVLGRGESKTSVVSQRGTQVDLRVVAEHQLGAALLYFTGSKGHNIKLRQRALARGLTLNEYALSEIEGGRIVASETEEEIYAALGLPWIPPVLREDVGEIDAAEDGRAARADRRRDRRLPRAHQALGRRALDARGGGRGGARARLPRARDHRARRGDALGRVGRDALLAQRAQIRGDARRARRLARAAARRRAEHRPRRRARLRRRSSAARSTGVSRRCTTTSSSDRAAQTRRVVTAMRDPSVRMIGHLSARMIGGRPPIELDLDAVFAAAEETGTALEVNGSLPRLDLSVDALRRAQSRDVTFVLTSDAHHRARARPRGLRGAQRRARVDAARARREHLAGRAAAPRGRRRGGPREGRDHLLRALKLPASGHRSGGRTEGGVRGSSRR